MVLTLYYDLISQPARSVWIFLKINKIPFEEKPISLFQVYRHLKQSNGAHDLVQKMYIANDSPFHQQDDIRREHKTPAYKAIVPACQVPAIKDDGFVLTECVAILQYLSAKYCSGSKDSWYPSDLKTRALVDEYMSWQHTGTRKCGVAYFVPKVLIPMRTQAPPDEEKIAAAVKDLQEKLTYIEEHFLDKGPYIAGEQPTIADIMAINEIMQPLAGGYDVVGKHPKIRDWMERVKKTLQPHFGEATKTLLQITAKVM